MYDSFELASVREAIDYYRDWIEYQQVHRRLPGVQFAVFVNGAVAVADAFGSADVELRTPLTSAHRFRVASHSKTLSTIATLRLVERGLLRLDDRLADHVPELEVTATVRDVLSHTGGITRDGNDNGYWHLSDAFPDRETLIAIARDPGAAVLPPGERFKYSNIAFGLLGLVIEAVTGTSYASTVARHILEPLDLDHTGTDLDPDRCAEYATGYSALSYASERRPLPHATTRALAPATGAASTASDLVTIFAALLPGARGLLSESSKRWMRRPDRAAFNTNDVYGHGVRLRFVDGRELFGHGGAFPGHRSTTLVDPDAAIAVSVASNAIDAPVDELALALPRLVTLAASHPRPEVEHDLLRFTGRFANSWGVWDGAVLGGHLYRIDPAQANPATTAQRLEHVGADEVEIVSGSGYAALRERMRFDFDSGGAVVSIRGASEAMSQPLRLFELACGVPARAPRGREPTRIVLPAAGSDPWQAVEAWLDAMTISELVELAEHGGDVGIQWREPLGLIDVDLREWAPWTEPGGLVTFAFSARPDHTPVRLSRVDVPGRAATAGLVGGLGSELPARSVRDVTLRVGGPAWRSTRARARIISAEHRGGQQRPVVAVGVCANHQGRPAALARFVRVRRQIRDTRGSGRGEALLQDLANEARRLAACAPATARG